MLNLTLIRVRALVAGIALAAAGSLAPPAVAELYKWVDENGVVQFSDRKPRDSSARDVETKVLRGTAAPAAPAAPAAEQAEASTEPPADSVPSADEQLAERDRIRALNCSQARDNLKILQGRYRIQDGNTGEYLDGAGRDARMAQTRADIEANC